MTADLTEASTHYEFGSNWKDYAKKIDEEAILQAEAGFLKLIPAEDIKGKTFLDIGSGSGLHSLAALRLGAKSVVAVDIDANSVETTRATLDQYWQGQNFDVRLVSVLAPEARDLGSFDIVYSWGVLHHTGAMWEAIEKAANHVRPGGQFVLAIYRKTPLCWAWKIEKRIFTNGSGFVRSLIRTPFIAAFKLGLRVTGRNPAQYIADYKGVRGMNFYNDIDDWLGGYPYESATEQEIVAFLAPLGFSLEQVYPASEQVGLFGTGCSEFRLRRSA